MAQIITRHRMAEMLPRGLPAPQKRLPRMGIAASDASLRSAEPFGFGQGRLARRPFPHLPFS